MARRGDAKKLSRADLQSNRSCGRECAATPAVWEPTLTSFENLKFVLNAARPPLCGVTDPEFEEIYGLNKTLKFKNAEQREVAPSDLWSTLY